MTTNWTEQERKIAYQNLLERCQDFGDFDQVGDEVLEAATELSCERNELISTLETIKSHLNPDDPDNYRADDSEGAMDAAFQLASEALAKCK